MSKYLINSITLLAIALILGTTAFGQSSTILGGYKLAKTDDARVVAAAEFAVGERAEKNPEQEGLTLDSVDKAEMQSVGGTNFRLCLTVSLEDESQQIEAVVYQDLKQIYSLKSWTVKDCSGKSESESAMIKKTFTNCTGNQLSLSEGEGDADIGGKRWGDFIFTNTSSTSCRLAGFPKFAALNKAGKVMTNIPVTYNNEFYGADESWKKMAAVTLESGKTASFRIFYNDGMALDHKKPFPVSAKARVTVPNDKQIFILKSEFTVCCGIEVSSIHPYSGDNAADQ